MVDAGDVAVAVGSEAFDLWLMMLKFRTWLVVILLLVVGMSYFAISDWALTMKVRTPHHRSILIQDGDIIPL